MEAEFLVLLTDSVQHASFQAMDMHGAPTYSTPVLRPARVEWTSQRFTTAQGEDRMSRAIVYFDANFVLQLADKLIFDDGTSPSIQRVDRQSDEQGNPHHMRVFL